MILNLRRKTTLKGLRRPKNRQNDAKLIISLLSRRPQDTHGHLWISWEANLKGSELDHKVLGGQDAKNLSKIALFDRILLFFRGFQHLIFIKLNGRA